MTDPQQATPPERRPDLDDTPPFLGSWRNIYLFVVTTLVVLIALFAYLTEHFR